MDPSDRESLNAAPVFTEQYFILNKKKEVKVFFFIPIKRFVTFIIYINIVVSIASFVSEFLTFYNYDGKWTEPYFYLMGSYSIIALP